MILKTVLILSTLVSLIKAQNHHELNAKRKIMSMLFNDPSKINSMEYEISHLTLKPDPHSGGKKFKRYVLNTHAFGHDISLELEENNHILFGSNTPIYLASTNSDGTIRYNTYSWPETNDIQFYHNKKKRAAFAVHTDTSEKIFIDGKMGDNIEIFSLPERAKKLLMRYNISSSESNNSHMIIRNKRQSSMQYYPYNSNIPYGYQQSQVYSTQDTVYPEILVVADYDTYVAQRSDIYSVARYVASLFTGYDLRFRQMSSPKIRLNIAGLVIPQDERAIPFAMRGTRVSDPAQRYMSQYLAYDTFYQSLNYDLVFVLLHRQAIYSTNGDMAGVTGLGITCQKKTGYGVAISMSTGSYLDSSVGVHELAHAFGSPHDGSGTTDGYSCPVTESYLMVPQSTDHTNDKSMFFSPCSITAMRNFLRSPGASCLNNKPSIGSPLKKTLPGKLLTRDEQCKKALGTEWISDKNQETNCRLLYCARASAPSSVYTPYSPPAEGSYCYPQYICLNGNCVRDPTLKQRNYN